MSNLDRLPERAVVRVIQENLQRTSELKAAQRVTGRSGQLGYSINSANDWDFLGSVAYTDVTFTTAIFHIIFTSDGTQRFPIAVPQFDVRINGTSSINRMVFDPALGEYEYEDAAVQVIAFEYGTPVASFFESETQSAWVLELFIIGLVAPGNLTLRIKPRAQSSCAGTFSVVRTS